jgi:hypothetical protein
MPESILLLTKHFDLQIALYLVGAFIIFALILNNFLRSRRLKKQMISSLTQAVMQETLSSGGIKEPHFGQLDQPEEKSLPPDTPARDAAQQLNVLGGEDQSQDNRYSSRIDPNIDCVVALKFELLINGAELLEKMAHWPSVPQYRIACEGLWELDDKVAWEQIESEHDYRELQVSMQLANRRGPLSKEDLAEFLGLASQLASDVEAEIDLPPMQNVLSDAQDLDHFAVQCDIQLSFSVVPNMISWGTKEVETVLTKNGFLLSRDGLFFNYFSHNHILFKAQIPAINFLTDDLQTQRIKSINFALDVPLVSNEWNAFTQMYETSAAIASELDGRVLDDNGNVLEANSIDVIISQLEPIYALMQERQILPGSVSALRLFS